MPTEISSLNQRSRGEKVLPDVALQKLTSPVHVATLGTHGEAVFLAEDSNDKTGTSGGPKQIPLRDKIDPQDTGVPAEPVSQRSRRRLACRRPKATRSCPAPEREGTDGVDGLGSALVGAAFAVVNEDVGFGDCAAGHVFSGERTR